MPTPAIHRRRSSKDNDENPSTVVFPVVDAKDAHRPPPLVLNGATTPPRRSSASLPSHSHSHSRTLSIPTPFSPSFPSPLATPLLPASPARKHTRIHSRNLSVFFPRPDSLTIAEDATQESDFSDASGGGASGQLVPGFSFGGRPSKAPDMPRPVSTSTGGMSRRGHHHKHSLSHNFFSFLEPGGPNLHTQPTQTPVSPWASISILPSAGPVAHFPPESQTHPSSVSPPAPTPPPPRISRSAFVWSVGQFVLGSRMWIAGQQIGALGCTGLGYWVVFDAFGVAISRVAPGWLAAGGNARNKIRRPYGNARMETVLMFAQAVYLMFASVYVCKEAVEHLLLSFGDGAGHGHGHGGGIGGGAVHSGAEGHHHHFAENAATGGVDFPLALTCLTLISLFSTAFVYDNHAKLVQIADNHIPPITILVRNILSPSYIRYHPSTNHQNHRPIDRILSNPYVAAPIFFCFAIVFIGLFVDPVYQRGSDLALAALEMIITFNVAYRACVVLGAVLLQTSPPRGRSGGRMEAFLRAMKEVERHPKVLHLPAPHLWQLTPSYTPLPPISSSNSKDGDLKLAREYPYMDMHARGHALVVTLELHIEADLEDEEVLKLTRWAWERCTRALGGRVSASGYELEELEGEDGVEVTVGVVRG